MEILKNASLRTKITWVTMTTAIATLVLALVTLSFVEFFNTRRVFRQELESLSEIVSANSIAAVEFNDPESANQTLSVLSRDPRILEAVIQDTKQRDFARYQAAPNGREHSNILARAFRRPIVVRESIIHQGKRIGTITITASTAPIVERLTDYGIAALSIALIALCGAFLLSGVLQHIISRPILRLAETARIVSREKNFTLRAERETNDETGELVQQFNTMLDTIDQFSKDLAESEQQLRTITDSLPVLISYVDRAERYLFNNAAYGTWFGLESRAVKGKKVAEVLGPETFARVEPYHKIALAGDPVQFETEINSPTLGKRSVSCSLIPDFDAAGLPRGTFGLFVDITERKAIEKERESFLARERLARAEAERASKLKDEFLAVLSHELRTPLNAILGWAQLLQKQLQSGSASPEQMSEGLNVITKNARIQTKLIADLLDLSRITSGKLILDLKPLRLEEVTRAAVETISMLAEHKKIALTFEAQPNLPYVMGDASRLEQVAWNLLTNAIKFTPQGGEVHLTVREARPGTVELVVSDSGQGIRPDFIPFVFERFRQADSSTTRKHGGLGIGLSLVRQLVEHHGGSVTATSDGEGKGATFTVQLPAADTKSEIDADIRTPLGNLTGYRLVLVDDDADARALATHMLEANGARVFVAENAAEALELVMKERPDALISDIGMPEHDGYDLLNWVRGLAPHQGGLTPAIALTAFARAEDRRRAFEAGFQAHVSKPIDERELLTAVERVFGQPDLDEQQGQNGTLTGPPVIPPR